MNACAGCCVCEDLVSMCVGLSTKPGVKCCKRQAQAWTSEKRPFPIIDCICIRPDGRRENPLCVRSVDEVLGMRFCFQGWLGLLDVTMYTYFDGLLALQLIVRPSLPVQITNGLMNEWADGDGLAHPRVTPPKICGSIVVTFPARAEHITSLLAGPAANATGLYASFV